MTVLDKLEDEYIEQLILNQNDVLDKTQQDLFSYEDYQKMLEPALSIIKNNPDLTIDELREKIYESSGLEDSIRDFIIKRKLAPSMSISYGTKNFVETVSVGDVSGNATTEDTIYDVASVTKLFTSMSVLKLSASGVLDLNKDVTYYLPEFEKLKGVTLLQLLTFQAPLRTEKRLDEAGIDYDEAYDRLKNVYINEDYKITDNPYTDMGAIILKEVVCRVTGKSFFSCFKENIIDKANMSDTHIIVPETKLDRVASTDNNITYVNGEFKFRNVNTGELNDVKGRILGQNVNDVGGNAGIFTSSNDMANLAIALMKYDILSKKQLEGMSENRTGMFINEVNRYRQYFGQLCYSKNPNLPDSEVDHPLSGKSLAMGGWTGCQFTLDPVNDVFFFMGSNRVHDRVVSLPKVARETNGDRIYNDNDGAEMVKINGNSYVNSSRFAWDRSDAIVNPALRLSLSYSFLEYVMKGYQSVNDSQLSGKKLRRL